MDIAIRFNLMGIIRPDHSLKRNAESSRKELRSVSYRRNQTDEDFSPFTKHPNSSLTKIREDGQRF
jgi:hypothetical protein